MEKFVCPFIKRATGLLSCYVLKTLSTATIKTQLLRDGVSPSGKALVSESSTRWFESNYPSQRESTAFWQCFFLLKKQNAFIGRLSRFPISKQVLMGALFLSAFFFHFLTSKKFYFVS